MNEWKMFNSNSMQNLGDTVEIMDNKTARVKVYTRKLTFCQSGVYDFCTK